MAKKNYQALVNLFQKMGLACGPCKIPKKPKVQTPSIMSKKAFGPPPRPVRPPMRIPGTEPIPGQQYAPEQVAGPPDDNYEASGQMAGQNSQLLTNPSGSGRSSWWDAGPGPWHGLESLFNGPGSASGHRAPVADPMQALNNTGNHESNGQPGTAGPVGEGPAHEEVAPPGGGFDGHSYMNMLPLLAGGVGLGAGALGAATSPGHRLRGATRAAVPALAAGGGAAAGHQLGQMLAPHATEAFGDMGGAMSPYAGALAGGLGGLGLGMLGNSYMSDPQKDEEDEKIKQEQLAQLAALAARGS